MLKWDKALACSAINTEIDGGIYEIEVTDRFGGQAIPDYVLDYTLYQDVSGGGRFDGAFVARGDDHYLLNLTLAQQRIQISTLDLRNQCAGDTQLVLLRRTADMGFERVAENDNFNDSPCSTLEFDDSSVGNIECRLWRRRGRHRSISTLCGPRRAMW